MPRVPAFTDAELENIFTYHKPFGDQPRRYELIRKGAFDFASVITGLTPPSAEQREAIHYLGLAVMLANAAIARNEKEPPPPRPELGVPLGVNLAGPAEWSADTWCTNAMKQGTEWYSQVPGKPHEEGKAMPLPLTPNGYPAMLDERSGQFAESLVYVDLPAGTRPFGPHVLTWDGIGRLEISDGGRVATLPEGAGGGGHPVDLAPDSPFVAVRIRKTDPRDHVRNVRLVHDGHRDRASPWLPYLPALLGTGFKLVRFMDWTMTNNANGVVKWDQRASVQDSTFVRRGVPWELCLKLAVETQCVPWLCVPHEADDDYVKNLASLIGSSGIETCFVEYSNECWNDQFEARQTGYVRRKGFEARLSGDRKVAGLRYYAQRSFAVHKMMQDILGPRVTRVLSWHHQDPEGGNAMLAWADAKAGADVIAVAPYFGHGDAVLKMVGNLMPQLEGAATDVEKLFKSGDPLGMVLDCCEELLERNREHTRDYKDIANSYGLRLCAYEAGQHLVAPYDLPPEDQQRVDEVFRAANRHPRMGELYEHYLRTWAADGGEAACLFSLVSKPDRHGSWGLLEHPGQVGPPKWQAVQALLHPELEVVT